MPAKVSVCIPTHNRAGYLRQALESVLRQTMQDFEIIVADDASTDETQKVVAGLSDERVRYFRHPHNVGVAANRNSCLMQASGEYIAWLDSDDIYLPEMLAAQCAVLDREPDAGLVHGAFEVIDEKGRRLPGWPLPFKNDLVERGRQAFRELVLCNYIAAPTVMVRRAVYDRAGLYAADLRHSSEDWEMWLRIALHADLAYTATPVAQYRHHEGSLTAATTGSGGRLRGDILAINCLFRQQRALLSEASAVRASAFAALAAKALIHAGDAFTLGRRGTAFRAVIGSLRLSGSLRSSSHGWRLLLSILRNDEYGSFHRSRAMLGILHAELAGTRFGERIGKLATLVPEWQQTLESIANTVRGLVPPDARIAVVDKWDPTLLHLSRRKGWHFPDRRLLPGGYPPDSGAAVGHLEELTRRGAQYLVFPNSAFWWLDYYADFRQHLDTRHQHIWTDDECVIYQLSQTHPDT